MSIKLGLLKRQKQNMYVHVILFPQHKGISVLILRISLPPRPSESQSQLQKSIFFSLYLFYFSILLDVNFLPAVLFQLHCSDRIQGNAAGQIRPVAYSLGADGAVDDFKHGLAVADVNGSAAKTKREARYPEAHQRL